jgi:hypothetical protein
VSGGDRTLKKIHGDEITTGPTGLYTPTLNSDKSPYWYLGTIGDFIWWDVTIEIYAAPDTIYLSNKIDMTNERLIGAVELPYIVMIGYDINFNHGGNYVWTDDKGRYTLKFSMGVFSDQIFGEIHYPGFGAPRSVTAL